MKRLEEKQKNSRRNAAVKPADEYTDEEKIRIFDEMHAEALRMLAVKENGDLQPCEDDTHYTWESVMSLLARDKTLFWSYWNSL